MAYSLGQPVLSSRGWTPSGTMALQQAVDAALRDDTIVLYGSVYHLEEGSRIPDDNARERFFRFFWSQVKWNVLIPTNELVLREAALGRPLEGNEAFESFDRRQCLRRLTRNKEESDELASKIKASVDQAVVASEDRRTGVTAKISAEYSAFTVAQVTERWWSEADSRIDDWTRDYMRSSKEHLGLGDVEANWPKPADLQTARAIHAYMMARIVMNVGLKRKIGAGDVHDAHHYASACYADVLVTEDGAFRDTIALIPASPVTVLSFDEFSSQFGIQPN